MAKGKKTLPAYKRLTDFKILKAISEGINYGRAIGQKLKIADSPFARYLYRLRDEGLIEETKKEFVLKDNSGTEFKFDTENNPYNIKYYNLTERGRELLNYFLEVESIKERYKELCNYCEKNAVKISSSRAGRNSIAPRSNSPTASQSEDLISVKEEFQKWNSPNSFQELPLTLILNSILLNTTKLLIKWIKYY